MKRLSVTALVLAAAPAQAASGPFFTFHNTNFTVLLSFLLFLGVLLYVKAPGKLTAMLDKRSAQIRADLDEARALRDEAKTILASYEKKKKDVQEQSDRIVAAAKEEATRAAAEAREELKRSIARRLAAAEDRITSAEKAAIREVREKAVSVAVAAAGDLLARQMTAEAASSSIDDAIRQVGAKLH